MQCFSNILKENQNELLREFIVGFFPRILAFKFLFSLYNKELLKLR